MTEGKKIADSDIIESMLTVPEGFDPAKKHCVGIKKNNKMIAFIELYDGLPAVGCVWLSLLLIHGDEKRKFIGTDIVKAVIEVSKVTQNKEIKLGVVINNIEAINFWTRLGFIKIDMSTVIQRNVKLEIAIFKFDLNDGIIKNDDMKIKKYEF